MSYSISDLEQLSGVQIHTIRMWERRYNALEPMRSAGNTRLYDDNHLRRLLNIVGLSKTGLKISHVCALSDQEIDNLLKEDIHSTISNDLKHEYHISQLLTFGIAYEATEFDKLIDICIKEYGMVNTYKNIIYPLLVRLGLMWRRDHICPAQEHFLSNIIRQKIYVAINELPIATGRSANWLLFLPEDEDHDIGLLFANYVLRLRGQKVLYLGAKVPYDTLENVIANSRVDHMLLFMTRSRPISDANEYLSRLATEYKNINIHIAGNTKLIGDLILADNINWFKTIDEFETIIKDTQHVA